MPAFPVEPPYPVFTDREGEPLENGYIWIGVANLDPQTNPVNVYWDAGLSIPAAQPIRTLAGYPVYQGTPTKLFTTEKYSIRVLDKNGTLVFSSLSFGSFPIGVIVLTENATGNGTQTIFSVSGTPIDIYINGVYQQKNTYSLVGTDIVFTQAPPVTSSIEFVY
jgi:hypothetical protein